MFETSTVNMKSAKLNALHIYNAITSHHAANSQWKDGTWQFWTYTAVKANMMHVLHIPFTRVDTRKKQTLSILCFTITRSVNTI